MDLSKCLERFTNLFPEKYLPTEEEHQPFMYPLQPILDQLITSQVPEEHQVPTVFYVLNDGALRTAAKIQKRDIDLDRFIAELNARN